MNCLKVFCMHEKSGEFITVLIESEENAEADVIDAAFHRSVHSLCVVSVIVLGSCRMKDLIRLFVICFLEEDVCSDSCFVKLSVVLYCSSCDVNVYTSDRAVLMLDRVDRLDALQDVFDRIVYRVLTCFDRKSLVTHVLQCDNLSLDLLLCELNSRNGLVLSVIRAVCASVDAVVGKIQGCEKNDSVAVEILLDLLCKCIDLLVLFGDVACEQNGCVTVRKSLALFGLLEDCVDDFNVALVLVCILKRFQYLFVVDEFFCF